MNGYTITADRGRRKITVRSSRHLMIETAPSIGALLKLSLPATAVVTYRGQPGHFGLKRFEVDLRTTKGSFQAWMDRLEQLLLHCPYVEQNGEMRVIRLPEKDMPSNLRVALKRVLPEAVDFTTLRMPQVEAMQISAKMLAYPELCELVARTSLAVFDGIPIKAGWRKQATGVKTLLLKEDDSPGFSTRPSFDPEFGIPLMQQG